MHCALTAAVGLFAIVAISMSCSESAAPSREAEVRAAESSMPQAFFAAVGSTAHMRPAVARAFAVTEQFPSLPVPGPNDWLTSHPERPQSVAGYTASVPNLPAPQGTRL